MASAIAFAGKTIENRSWRTHFRGPIAIHASAALHPCGLHYPLRTERGGQKRPIIEWINKGRKSYGLDPQDDDSIDYSAIVAIAMLVDCIDKSSSPWFQGDWGWVFEGIIPIEPVPYVGALSLWDCKFKYRPL